MEDIIEAIGEAVTQEARRASNRWNNMVDAEDIEQELWAWILESPSIQKYLSSGNKPQLSKALRRKSDSIASQERISYEHFSGQFSYTPAEVRHLLNSYYNSSVPEVSVEVMQLAEEKLSKTTISNILGSNISSDERVDLEEALADLGATNENYLDALIRQYFLGLKAENKSEEHARDRGVTKLTDFMNRKRSQRTTDRVDGPGTRPPAQARQNTTQYY